MVRHSINRLLNYLTGRRLAAWLTVIGIGLLAGAYFVHDEYAQSLMLHVGVALALAAVLFAIEKRLERKILGLSETQQLLRSALIASAGRTKTKREAILEAVATAGKTIVDAGFRQEQDACRGGELLLVYHGTPEVRWRIMWADGDGLRQLVTVEGREQRYTNRKHPGVVFNDDPSDATDAQSVRAFHSEVNELLLRVLKLVQQHESGTWVWLRKIRRSESSTQVR